MRFLPGNHMFWYQNFGFLPMCPVFWQEGVPEKPGLPSYAFLNGPTAGRPQFPWAPAQSRCRTADQRRVSGCCKVAVFTLDSARPPTPSWGLQYICIWAKLCCVGGWLFQHTLFFVYLWTSSALRVSRREDSTHVRTSCRVQVKTAELFVMVTGFLMKRPIVAEN